MKFHPLKIGIVLLLLCVAAAAQEKAEYSIVSAKSKIEIRVYKEGLFKAFGHNHLIEAKQMRSLKAVAKREKVSLAEVVRRAISAYLEMRK